MSETWLKPRVPDNFVGLQGYRLFRLDREDRGGGGIGVYLRVGVVACVLAASPGSYCGQPEYMFMRIAGTGVVPLLLGVIYRPPKLGHFASFLADYERLHPSFSIAVIIGDFNIDLNRTTHDSEFLRDFCASNHLFIVPFSNTHHTASSHTRIDHCLVSDESLLISFNQRDLPCLSTHDLIEVTVDYRIPRSPPRLIHIRDYSRYDAVAFCNSLQALDWSAVLYETSLDARIETFNHFLSSTHDSHAPQRSFMANRPPAPWLSAPIRSLMRRRNAARWALRRLPSPARRNVFRSLRNEVHLAIDRARNDYLFARLGSIKNTARLWSELRSLGLAKSRPSLTHHDFSLDQLNSSFASFSSPVSLHHASHSSTSPASGISASTFSFPPVSDPSIFYFLHITPTTLREALLKCKSNSSGPDHITRRLLFDSLPVTFSIILDLFNSSLDHAIFPSTWKRSYIIPLPKVKNPSSPSDFRPISLLCYLSKVLERIVYDQISFHLNHHDLLDHFQAGFRAGHSTQTALVRLTDGVRLAIDKRMVTLLVLFDFTKAFDTVNHGLLLRKLLEHRLSAPVVAWFESYLSARSQRVRGPDGAFSAWAPVAAGVPQGSVLGPLLFAIFINDLRHSLKHCQHILYADDLQIYFHFLPSDLVSAVGKVREDIAAIESWATDNCLKLNATKTKAMLLGSARYVGAVRVLDIDIRLDGVPIELATHVTNLGIHMTSTLSWSEHVKIISNRVNGALWRLKHCRGGLSIPLRIRLVSSLIFPIFDYCSAVFTDLTSQLRLRLGRLMNSCIRFIFDLRRDEHISDWYEVLGWLTSDERRAYLTCCFLFSILRTGSPTYLACDFKPRLNARVCSRAPTRDLAIPTCRTSTYQRSFVYTAASMWNSLPIGIRDLDSVRSFRYGLFNHLRQRG